MKTDNQRIYLDNAATTWLDDDVLQAMLPFWIQKFGNPSSQYSYGREARLAVEKARKEMAALLGVQPACLTFTSCATESSNTAIANAVQQLGCTHILYSPTEHHAVLHPVQHYATGPVSSSPLRLEGEGLVDLVVLETQLAYHQKEGRRCLVCVMHANNETGVINNIRAIGEYCRRYDAIFFSDCVATIGHLPLQLADLPVDFASASAHKFHGPKGIGLLYTRPGLTPSPLIHGGAQERERRAGTENVAGIVGMARALSLFQQEYEKQSPYIRHLRLFAWRQLTATIPGVRLNGSINEGLYTILSIGIPHSPLSENILLALDQAGICVSAGSACNAGAASHVMRALRRTDDITVRLSFSKYNTMDEIQHFTKILAGLIAGTPVHGGLSTTP